MIKTWNATALTGGIARALDAIPTASLTDGDRAFVVVSNVIYYFEFDAASTDAESSPDLIRPDDYSTAGVWKLGRMFTDISVVEGAGIDVSLSDTVYTVSSPLAVSAVQPDRSISSGGGLTGGGDLSTNRTISHSDTSSQSSVNNSGSAVIQDVSVDSYGHVTSLGSVAITASLVGALPTSGGTMNGNVTMAGGTFSFDNTSTSAWNYITDVNHGQVLWRDSSDNLVVGAGNSGKWTELRGTAVDLISYGGSISRLSFTGAFFYPVTNNHVNLGGEGARWKEVWASSGVINTSDERAKDIEAIGDVTWVYNLKPIKFYWKDKDAYNSKLHYGFSAQHTESIVSDTGIVHVPKNSENMWGMQPTELIAPMLQLIKDQKTKIDELESRLVILETK